MTIYPVEILVSPEPHDERKLFCRENIFKYNKLFYRGNYIV